ncbi:hypothetical protein [Lyngbya aestuarii]
MAIATDAHQKVRFLYHNIGDEFRDFLMMALWDDGKFGLAHYH